MSQAEIISEIPKLSHEERREIVRCIIEAEEDAETLAACDRARWKISRCSTQWKPRMKRTLPGEIWRVDLGLAAKVRPALVLSDYPRDDELALLVIIPHTTALRGSRWELSIPKAFLKPGAFHLQQVQPVSLARFDAKLGVLTPEEFKLLKQTLIRLLNLHV